MSCRRYDIANQSRSWLISSGCSWTPSSDGVEAQKDHAVEGEASDTQSSQRSILAGQPHPVNVPDSQSSQASLMVMSDAKGSSDLVECSQPMQELMNTSKELRLQEQWGEKPTDGFNGEENMASEQGPSSASHPVLHARFDRKWGANQRLRGQYCHPELVRKLTSRGGLPQPCCGLYQPYIYI